MEVKQGVGGLKFCLLCFFALLKHHHWACQEKGSVGPEPQESEQRNYSGMVSENLGLEEEEMVKSRSLCDFYTQLGFPRKFLAPLCPTVWLG